MILAGDIGGTKTVLALISAEIGPKRPRRQARFASADFGRLEDVVAAFLNEGGEAPTAACFGVAGPVVAGEAKITNLPWVINGRALSADFGLDTVHLINDLQAIATAVPHLAAEDLATLQGGQASATGTIAVIAPGTGIGMSFLAWAGDRHRAYPTEGGHASFAPATAEQVDLLAFLHHRFGHVSVERVCSGSGIPNLYDFLRTTGRYAEPAWLGHALAQADDPTPVIVGAALERKAEVCVACLDMFVRILGGVVGNMALMTLATGGVYLGGGIPPRILGRLQQPDFLAAVRSKGRFSGLLADIPIHVILDPEAALHGAAWWALDAEGR